MVVDIYLLKLKFTICSPLGCIGVECRATSVVKNWQYWLLGIGAVEGNFSGGASMRDRQADRRQIVGQKYFQTSTAGDDDDQLRR